MPLAIQLGWSWCNHCQGLWYSADGPSVCTDRQSHRLDGSGLYVLAFQEAGSPDASGLQQGWEWCRKCGGLFYGPNQPTSCCPVDGGSHDGSGSGNYVLAVGVTAPASSAVEGVPAQPYWLWCNKCQGLFYHGPELPTSRCPRDGGAHDSTGSGQYTVSVTNWKSGAPQPRLTQRDWQPSGDYPRGLATYAFVIFENAPSMDMTPCKLTLVGGPWQLSSGVRSGDVFAIPVSDGLQRVVVEHPNNGTKMLTLQPYDMVLQNNADPTQNYDIFHFFHDADNPQVVWAIGVARAYKTDQGTTVSQSSASLNHLSILSSNDYFDTFSEAYRIPTPDSATWNNNNFQINQSDPSSPSYGMFNGAPYRSMYIDQYRNIIIAWRPGPLILRNGHTSFEPIGFNWVSEDHAELCPFWNITEDDAGVLIITEYSPKQYAQFPHRIWFSTDKDRGTWLSNVVGPESGTDLYKGFRGKFVHVHGYHINPVNRNFHHFLIGDWDCVGLTVSKYAEADCGYYIGNVGREDGFWSTEVLREWMKKELQANGKSFSEEDDLQYVNGPCFITWWPDGRALITSDTPISDKNPLGGAWWWGTGGPDPADWGGDRFAPVINLKTVDPDAAFPDCPWMGVAVSDNHKGEAYCTTSNNAPDKDVPNPKEIIFRLDGIGKTGTYETTVLAESWNNATRSNTLRWLSASRHNQIPGQAKYFFTSGNRRFRRY